MKALQSLKPVLPIGLVSWIGSTGTTPAQTAADYVEGEVLVTFKDSVNLESARQVTRQHSLEMARHFRGLSDHQHRVFTLLRSKTRSTAALIAELKQNPSVEVAEPNHLRWPCDMRSPNDPLFPRLWALRNTGQSVNGSVGTAGADISFLTGWRMAQSATGEVVVAVIDTGVDYTHPDLAGNVWTNLAEVPGNGIDDDGNGYPDDVHGYDFAGGTNDPIDPSDHGTHVAGTIASMGNNGSGVIGVGFQARIMALRASSDGTYLTEAAVIEAVQYAVMIKKGGVNVVCINASFGGSSFNSTERAAIRAAGDVGIAFCAAAGNSAGNNDASPFYPANYRLPSMIVVAASDQKDDLADFSSYGATTVDLAAPGANILSTLPVSLGSIDSYVQRASTIYAADGLAYPGLTTGLTATIYDCGLGYASNFPPAVSGNIALIQRGTLLFSSKVLNAIAAGARAAILYNNVAGNFTGTLQYASNWIPAVSISQADGQLLLSALPATGTVVNALGTDSVYQYLDGTSMATPHVAGAVAFAAVNFPAEDVTQRVGAPLVVTERALQWCAETTPA